MSYNNMDCQDVNGISGFLHAGKNGMSTNPDIPSAVEKGKIPMVKPLFSSALFWLLPSRYNFCCQSVKSILPGQLIYRARKQADSVFYLPILPGPITPIMLFITYFNCNVTTDWL
jgi:hypothetical protein